MLKNLKLIKFNNLPNNKASVCTIQCQKIFNNPKCLPNVFNNNSRMYGVQAQPKLNDDATTKRDLEWENALPYDKIPGPSAVGLIMKFMPGGKYYNIKLTDLHRLFREEYGSILRLPGNLGRPSIVFCFDPNDFEKVFRTEGIWPERRVLDSFVHYRKNVRPDIFKGMGGLLTEHGQPWQEVRTKVNPVMLKPQTVKMYISQVDKVSQDFIEIIKQQRDKVNEVPPDFGHTVNKWALESIGVIALDSRLGVLKEDTEQSKMMIQSVKTFFQLSYELDILPSIWKYYKTPKFNKLMKCFDFMTNYILQSVEKGIQNIENKEKKDEKNENEMSVLEKLLKQDKHIAVVMAMDMLLAGIDTTGSMTLGVLYQLAKNPEKQEKLRKEIMQILPEKNSTLNSESLRNIPYLRACLKETLRIVPVTSGNMRGIGQDLVIKGYRIPKGTNVAMSNALLQIEEENFPKSDEFLPERWLKNSDAAQNAECPHSKSAHPFVYLPFGFGPRTCIGRRFSEMEVEVLIARILREFKVEWHYPDMKYVQGLINVPGGDIKFRFIDLEN